MSNQETDMIDDTSLNQIAGFVKAKIEQAQDELRSEFGGLLEQMVGQMNAALEQQGMAIVGLWERMMPESYQRWLMDQMIEQGVPLASYAEQVRKARARAEQEKGEDGDPRRIPTNADGGRNGADLPG